VRRRLVVALATLVALGWLLARVARGGWPGGPAEVPRWLVTPPASARVLALGTLGAWACLARLAVAVVAAAVRPGRARAPGVFGGLAARILGVAAAGAAAGVLAAGPAVADGPGGPFDRPVDSPRPAARAGPVVVARGDTLWGIAARAAGARASPRLVAAAWPRWYAANRAVVGPDPDRILPGQRLSPPAGRPEGSR
jgi:nucleoid-associated protein YgaU